VSTERYNARQQTFYVSPGEAGLNSVFLALKREGALQTAEKLRPGSTAGAREPA
jgi:hypothetical protein